MSFQKIIFVVAFLGIVAGGFIMNAQPAQAATVEELMALIAQLKAQILQLQQQLAQSQGQPAQWCHDFNTNIRLGDSGDEVYALQFALSKEGLFGESDETSDKTFGEQTASAVVGFQQKYRSEILTPFGLKFGTGFVGKGTRAKLNALYGCGEFRPGPPPIPLSTPLPISTPFIAVRSPNGGETWATGSSQTIQWSASSNIKQVSISLSPAISSLRWSSIAPPLANSGSYGWIVDTQGREIGPYMLQICGYLSTLTPLDEPLVCAKSQIFSIVDKVSTQPSITVISPNGGETIAPDASYRVIWGYSGGIYSQVDILLAVFNGEGRQLGSHYLIAAGVSASQRAYGWSPKQVFSISNFPEGAAKYKIVIREANDSISAISDTSDNYFSIVSALKATDSDNSPDYTFGVASYPITLQKYPDLFSAQVGKGDYVGGGPCIYGTEPNPTSCKPTSDTFTTFYDHCVGPTQLNEAFVNSSGKLSAMGVFPPSGYECRSGAFFPIQQPSITVLSPNGGEQLQIGSTYRIKWNSANMYNVRINIANDTNTGSGSTNYIIPYNNATSASVGYYDWTITSQQLPIGTRNDRYKIFIYNNENSSIFDSSDNYFTIVGAETIAPSITVLSPNGGERWAMDKTYTITWQQNLAGNFEAWIDLLRGGLYAGSIAGDAVRISNAQNITSYSWLVGDTIDIKGIIGPGSDYQVRITYNDVNTGKMLTDTSDNYFSIVSATPSITSFNYTETDAYNGSVQFYWTNSGTDSVNLWIPCYSGLTIKNAATGANFACGESDLMFPSNSSTYLKFTNSSGSIINASAIIAPITSSATSVTIYSNYSKTINFSIVAASSSFRNIEDQTASISDAVSRLLQSFEEFKKSNP